MARKGRLSRPHLLFFVKVGRCLACSPGWPGPGTTWWHLHAAPLLGQLGSGATQMNSPNWVAVVFPQGTHPPNNLASC